MRATKQLKRKTPPLPPPPMTAEELALRAERQARRERAEEVRARLAPMPAQGGRDPQWAGACRLSKKLQYIGVQMSVALDQTVALRTLINAVENYQTALTHVMAGTQLDGLSLTQEDLKPLRDELFGLARIGRHYATFPFEGVLGEDQG